MNGSQTRQGDVVSDVKQRVARILDQLPDDCSLEDVQYRLYVVETIRRRLESADGAGGVSQAEVEKQLKKWLTP